MSLVHTLISGVSLDLCLALRFLMCASAPVQHRIRLPRALGRAFLVVFWLWPTSCFAWTTNVMFSFPPDLLERMRAWTGQDDGGSFAAVRVLFGPKRVPTLCDLQVVP